MGFRYQDITIPQPGTDIDEAATQASLEQIADANARLEQAKAACTSPEIGHRIGWLTFHAKQDVRRISELDFNQIISPSRLQKGRVTIWEKINFRDDDELAQIVAQLQERMQRDMSMTSDSEFALRMQDALAITEAQSDVEHARFDLAQASPFRDVENQNAPVPSSAQFIGERGVHARTAGCAHWLLKQIV